MLKLGISCFWGLIFISIGGSAFANDTGSILGHTTGETFDEVKISLENKGFSVDVFSQAYEVDPSKKFDNYLVAKRPQTEEVKEDTVILVSDLHPTEPHASIITREIVYQEGRGPSTEKFINALTKPMGPQFSSREFKRGYNNTHTFKYRWKNFKLKKRKSYRSADKCLAYSALEPSSIKENKFLKYRNFDFHKNTHFDPRKDNILFYQTKCGKMGYVTISEDKETQLVTNARMTLMDHVQVNVSNYYWDEWASKAQLVSSAKKKKKLDALKENSPEPEL